MNKVLYFLLIAPGLIMAAESPIDYPWYQIHKNPTLIQKATDGWQLTKKGVLNHKGKLLIGAALITFMKIVIPKISKIERSFVEAMYERFDQHSIHLETFPEKERNGLRMLACAAYLWGFTYKDLVTNNPARIAGIEKALDEIAKNNKQ